MELFKLLGTIAVDNDKANRAIDETTGKAQGSGNKFSSAMGKVGGVAVKVAKVGAAAFGVAATGIAAMTKMAVSNYADYEQLVGGVETLFKDSSKKVMEYADNAYKTAGMSANAYMETVTSFSASLLQGLGGDTEKAADVADQAITDMSDNANKMGTSMELIQNAYQGFAKQNYTMLDNLKLGYGGTASEMARLVNESGVLGDSMKVTAQTVNDVSFDKIIEAIHKVQDNMGITGTTAKEAASTIQGSISMMKGAWQNFLTGMADPSQDFGKLLGNLIDSVVTVTNNIIPRIVETIPRVVDGISKLIGGLVPQIVPMMQKLVPELLKGAADITAQLFKGLMTGITSGLPKLMQSGTEFIGKLGDGVKTGFPKFMSSVMDIFVKLSETIMQNGPSLIKAGAEFISNLAEGTKTGLPKFISSVLDVLLNLSETLRESAPSLIQAGLDMIVKLAQGIMSALPALISKLPTIVSNIAGVINDNAPKLITTGLKLIATLAIGLIKAIPALIVNIPKIIKAIIDVFLAFGWAKIGKSIITLFKDGIMSAVGLVKTAGTKLKDTVVNAIKELPTKLVNLAKQGVQKFANLIKGAGGVREAAGRIVSVVVNVIKSLPGKMLKIGGDLVRGLWSGIANVKDWIVSKVAGFGKSILDGIKSFFGIHSPSKVMEMQVGKQLALGVANGIKKNTKYAKKSASELSQIILDAATKKLDRYKTYNNMSLVAEAKYWDTVRKQCKKGSAARLEADKSYFEAKKNLNEQLIAAEDEYNAKVGEVSQKIEDRAKSILSTFSLFEAFDIGETVDSTSLINGLETQVSALYEWEYQMNALKGKIGDSDLYDTIEEMGISSLQQVKAINSMTQSELSKYVTLFNARQTAAKKQATNELADESAQEISVAYKELEKKCKTIGVTINKTGTDTLKNVKDLTVKISDSFSLKMEDSLDSVKNGLSKMGKAFSSFVPKIKLPHINVTGKFNVDKGSVPKFNVEWYKDGAILKKPTAFGINPVTGRTMAGGEAGPEAVAPIDTLLGYVKTAVNESSDTSILSDIKALLERLIELVLQGSDIIVPVYIGNEKIDEMIVNARQRMTNRSGGYANV